MGAKTVLVVLCAGALLVAVAAWAGLRPSHERAWRPEQAVLPDVSIRDSLVQIRNVRNFRYQSAVDFTPAYDDRTYDLNQIERVWFILSPFNPDWRGPAHAFLSFSFADSQFVSISVEARREVGEEYSVWQGALRKFELMYVIGDERDLVGLRAVTWNDPVYLYPMRATPEQARALFLALLRRAQALAQQPEFYNTITNNCTTNLRDAVEQIAPGKIPYGIDVLLPGYTDQLAHELGLIDTELPLEAARTRFQVNARAASAAAAPDFSFKIRG